MRRSALPTALLLAALAGCLHPRPTWTLLQPPEVQNENFPRGFQILSGAPISDWHRIDSYDSQAACEEARQRRTDEAIDRARTTQGEDAKFDLDVRRAVNTRCVTAAR
jgi:hypothetical protein